MTMRDVPIRRKLMLIMLMISAAVMLLMRSAFFTYEYLTLKHTLVRQVTTVGGILATNSTAALAFDNRDDAREILAALKAERHIVVAALYDQDGRFFSSYPDTLMPRDLPATPGTDGYGFVDSDLIGFQPVVQKDRRLGTLYLKFDAGTILKEFVVVSFQITVAVMAVVLLVAYLLSRTLQKQISLPILALADTARAVTERGDYSVRATHRGRDELGLLTDAFNGMLEQIQELNRDLERRVVQRTAELEAANKELEAFSYSVSHDLRAPLRHIDGFAGLLVKADGPQLSERGGRYLAQISDSAKQMGTLIDDLLSFSRMGRSEMRISSVNLKKLTEETIESLRTEIQQRNVRWNVEPLPVVPGDQAMLRQVLVNLLANAIKYTRPRDPAEITIGCQPDGSPDEVVVYVRDNGVGFEMKYAAKLFGVFQRLHRAEEFEGTGIGLANVRRIILRHGGRTWAESHPGAGTVFYFSLPKQKEPNHEEPQTNPAG